MRLWRNCLGFQLGDRLLDSCKVVWNFLTFAAILSRRKIPLRAPSRRLDADRVHSQRSPIRDGPIAVAVEQVKGAQVYMLGKYEYLHLYPVPSTMSVSMRQALYPSGAKDDPRDADLLLDLLLQNRDKLRRLTPDNEVTRRVQNLVEEGGKLVEEKTAQLNRLTGYLKVYFPQMLEWFAKLDTK